MRDDVHQFSEYIESVISGKRNAGKYERLSVMRHLDDLKKSPASGFRFNEAKAQKMISCFRRFRHTKGDYAGRPFDLQPFQAFVIGCVYGWERIDSGLRRFNKVYKKIGRKNGKTEFLAGIANIGLCFDDEHGAEIYWAATKRDQAKIGWSRQKSMMQLMRRDSPFIAEKFGVNAIRIFSNSEDSFAVALGKDSKTEDGTFPHYALIDEYHAHPDSGLLDVLESGTGARAQPIVWIITTAGFNINGACKMFEDRCKDILDGKISNDDIFIIIFDIDEDDNWEDEAVWDKANPALGHALNIEFMRSEYGKALTEGQSKEINFRTKNLNTWLRQSETWVSDLEWMRNGSEWDIEEMRGRKCYGAIDLSSVSDITAVGLLFPPTEEDDSFRFYAKYYCPEDNAVNRSRKDLVPYLEWARSKNIVLTPGNVIDFEYIENDVRDFLTMFTVKHMGYDPWQSQNLAQRLTAEGAPMLEFRQTVTTFNEPIKFLEQAIRKGKVDHRNCPVLRWMIGNIAIFRNSTGLMKFDKEKSREKIDGAVVLAMCVGLYLHEQGGDKTSAYEERGLRII